MDLKFEDYIDVIDREIIKRKNQVHLYLNDFDFDDIAQIIRLHIYQKWHLWDTQRPLENWVNVIISRQIKNFIRNNYTSVAPPCYKCPMNQGGSLCSFTSSGEQCSECPLYKKWELGKKDGFNIKFPTSLHETSDEDGRFLGDKIENGSTDINWEVVVKSLSKNLKLRLSKELYFVYDFLYVKGKTDEELARVLKFKTSEKKRVPGYKQIYNFKQKIITEAKLILKEEDIL
jgi:hypothetical protein